MLLNDPFNGTCHHGSLVMNMKESWRLLLLLRVPQPMESRLRVKILTCSLAIISDFLSLRIQKIREAEKQVNQIALGLSSTRDICGFQFSVALFLRDIRQLPFNLFLGSFNLSPLSHF